MPSSLTPRSTTLACDALHERQAGFVLPFGDGVAGGVGDDHRNRSDDGSHVGGAGQHGVITIDRRRLCDVERLAGRDVRQIVDDDDAGHHVHRGELTGEGSADLAGADDNSSAHGDIL
jgi:hypothetical protein